MNDCECQLGGRSILPDPLQKIYDWLLPNRKNKLPPRVRELIKKTSHLRIMSINVCRKPVNSNLQKVLNVISLNGLEAGKKSMNYDDVYHLYLHIVLQGNLQLKFERNQVINLEIVKNIGTNDYQKVKLDKAITFGDFVNKAVKGKGQEFFEYDVVNGNCQFFCRDILRANGLLTPELEKYIMQDVEGVMRSTPAYAKPLVDAVTDFANRIDMAIQGEGILKKKRKKQKAC